MIREECMQYNAKLVIRLFVLGMCWALIYSLGFIQYLLYDPFREALSCSNEQLGILMMIFGLGNIVGAPLGGWLADRYDFRKIYALAMAGNGALSFIFAMHMTYAVAVYIWIGLAVTTLVMSYPAHIKIVRMLADDKNQGKIFGLNESSVGVGNIIINMIFLYVFARYVESAGGVQAVVVCIGILSMIFAAAAWFVIRDLKSPAEANGVEDKERMTAKDFLYVVKSPATWILGLSIFSIYTMAVTMSYFTPYITSVLGGTVAFSGIVSIIRTHGFRLLGAPFGGYLTDKIGSPSKVLIGIYIASIATLLLFLCLPAGTAMYVFIFCMLMVGLLVYMGKGIYYAVASELFIPRKYAASTVGVAAALGFSPDIFLFPLAGYWLDTYQGEGYTYLFIFQICALSVGVFGSLYALHYKKKLIKQGKANT